MKTHRQKTLRAIASKWPHLRQLPIGLILRILGSIALLWFVMREVAVMEVATTLRRTVHNWPYILIVLMLPALATVIRALRWRVLLNTQRSSVPVLELCRADLVGAFYNQMLPSTIGGDVIRSYWVSKLPTSSPKSSGATVLNLTVVGVDRLMGVLSLFVTGLLAALASPAIVLKVPQLWWILSLVALGSVALALLPRLPVRSVGRWLFSISILRKLRDKAVIVYRTLRAYEGNKRPLVLAFLLSLAIQVNIIVQWWVLSMALDVGLSIREVAVVVPVVGMISMIPITINGIGLRENALYVLGAPLGLTAANAIALAWAFLGVRLFYGLLGGLLQFRGFPKQVESKFTNT